MKKSFEQFLDDLSVLPRVTSGYVYTYDDAIKDDYKDRVANAIPVLSIRTNRNETKEEAEEMLMKNCIVVMEGKKQVFIREIPNVAYYVECFDKPDGWYGRARIAVSND